MEMEMANPTVIAVVKIMADSAEYLVWPICFAGIVMSIFGAFRKGK